MKFKEKRKQEERRSHWQRKLDNARRAYAQQRQRMSERNAYYTGTHEIKSMNGKAAKSASNVRNIVYELIESQVDSTVPQPRVTAIHPEDAPLAKKIEALLLNETRLLRFKSMNDLQERTVPIQGGDYWHVEWDPSAGFHCTLGDLAVTERHPKQIIPQPGVYDVDKMDYIFVLLSQTKKSLWDRYGVRVEEDAESDPDARLDADDVVVDDLVTQNIVYYRNESGGIGMYSWVGSQTLEDLEDYQARRQEVCAKCGQPKTAQECPECGGKTFRWEAQRDEVLSEDITIGGGITIAAQTPGADVPVLNPDGSPQLDEITGGAILMPGDPVPTRIPSYKPDRFPLILRRNVHVPGRLLGYSDVDVIEDQQVAIAKYGTKIEEKLLKGGSYVTLPKGVQVETTDSELKVLRVKNPADKALIGVITVQPDTSRDQQMLEVNYNWAKSSLGITDAFQGKYDASATSGTAKQFSASQSAGRLQSKREMKNEAYADLYRMMFQFALAYSDEAYPITSSTPDGEQVFDHWNRYEFLKQDDAGNLYWNDEFIFEVDPASNLASNRETMWNMIDVKYQAGGFGPLNQLSSQYRLWTLLAETGYPYADKIKQSIKQEMDQQSMFAQQPGGMGDLPAAQMNGDPAMQTVR